MKKVACQDLNMNKCNALSGRSDAVGLSGGVKEEFVEDTTAITGFAQVAEDVEFLPNLHRKTYEGFAGDKDAFVSPEDSQRMLWARTGDPNARPQPFPEGFCLSVEE